MPFPIPPLRVGLLALFALWLPLASSALAAEPSTDRLSSLRAAHAPHKIALLELEQRLRTEAGAALTGVPGGAVVLLACGGSGCIGPHRVTVSSADSPSSQVLDQVFAAGGWLPLVLSAAPGTPLTVTWQAGEARLSAALSAPRTDELALVVREAGALKLLTGLTPSVDFARRVHLAERARGDRLAAIAVLEAAQAHFDDFTAADRLMLADLLLAAGLPERAGNIFAALADAVDVDLARRANLGLATIALEANQPERVLSLLKGRAAPAGHPLEGPIKDVQTRAFLALDRGREATEVLDLPLTDPFASVNRAIAFHAVGAIGPALAELHRAARLTNPSVALEAHLKERILLMLGTIYGEQDRLSESLNSFELMSPLGPLGDRYRFGRGMAFYHHRDYVKAVAEFQTMEHDWPGSPYTLEGLLVMAECFRKLNAPRQAVTEYRKALTRFQARIGAIDGVLEASVGSRFDSGISGRLFVPERGFAPLKPEAPEAIALKLLAADDAVAALVDDYRQIHLSLARLERLNVRLAGGGRAAAAREVSAGIEGVSVYRTLFIMAARQVIANTLAAERDRLDELSVAASMGITQSVLFDRTGGDGRALSFEHAK